MKQPSDQLLFDSLKNGSEAAFTAVYENNRSLFLNFGRKFGLDDTILLDIYQDTYIAFFENIANGRLVELKSRISTYLISIGKYKILEQLRKNSKKVNSDIVLNLTHETNSDIDTFDLDNEELSKEQKDLQLNFEMLGEKCRKILTMFYYKNYSIKQIMAAGGYNNENVVKSQKSRCLKTLKDAMKNSPK